MTENAIVEPVVEKRTAGAGCLAELGWWLSGAILPMGSLSFYRKAAKRSVASAIIFFSVGDQVVDVARPTWRPWR